jgi:hypothetical protein
VTKAPRTHRAWPLAFAGTALVYLYFIPYFPALNNPNENARVYQIRAAVELHKLSVNEQIARYGPVNDLGKRDGKYYSGKAPGTTFLGAPIYAALRLFDAAAGHRETPPFRLLYTLRLVGTLLPTLGFLLAWRRFVGRLAVDPHIATALAVLLALGTMLLPYALLFVNHSLTAVCSFGALITIESAAQPVLARGDGSARRAALFWRAALAGFFIAFSAALDYAMLPVSVMLVVYAALRLRLSPLSIAAVAAGAAPPSIATAIYHMVCWGGPLKTPIGFLANPVFLANQSKGFFGIVGMTRESMFGVLLSPAKGLLYFSPFFAAGIAALVVACVRSRHRRMAILSALVTLWMIIYAGSLINWDAGWTVGPRYMTVIVPFVVFGMALAWEAIGERARKIALPVSIGLGIAAILLTAPASVLFPHLPPEYKNPVFEIIWPLWRDGITPHSLGRSLLGLSGRSDQVPVLTILAALLVYLVWVASGRYEAPRPPAMKSALRAGVALVTAAATLWLASLPRTEPRRTVDTGTAWIRTTIWEPRLTGAGGPRGAR